MREHTLRPLDFSKFKWRTCPDDSRRHLREAAGGEALEEVWTRLKHNDQILFVGAQIDIVTQHSSLEDLVDLVRTAWISTRFSIPTVAAHTEQDEAGAALITYQEASDEVDVDDWAQRTIRVSEAPNFIELRHELAEKRLPEASGDQTFIYLILPRSSDRSTASSTTIELLLHSHHTPFDGAGTKVVISRLLRILADYIEDPERAVQDREEMAWGTGKEAKNLLPVSVEVTEDEERGGENYARTLKNILNDMGTALQAPYGFTSRGEGFGPTRHLRVAFTAGESARFFAAVRSAGLTVNQVANAALCLVCLSDNPPTPSLSPDATLTFFGLIDGRSRLIHSYSSRGAYPGYCLGMSPIFVPVAPLAAALRAGGDERTLLLQVAQVVKAAYTKQRAYPALLAVHVAEAELVLEGYRQNVQQPPWMGPWFSGDGFAETHLDTDYAYTNGKPVLSVTDYFLSINRVDPGPFFRAHTFRDRFTLSVDYNSGAMPAAAVQGFLDKWADLMRLVPDSDSRGQRQREGWYKYIGYRLGSLWPRAHAAGAR